MIPLKDTIPSRTFPIITIFLIIINVLIFFFEVSSGPNLERLLFTYGLIPKRYFLVSHLNRYMPFFTAMFLHGGWVHLLGNMWYLWIFGDNVEDAIGHKNFLLFYIICGIAAGFTHVYAHSSSTLPTIGASGAVSGVMGGYFVLFPYARIITLVPIFFFISIIQIPAIFFLFFWFMIQFFNGTFSIISPYTFTGVAWWAHIGGFVWGIVLVLFFKMWKIAKK